MKNNVSTGPVGPTAHVAIKKGRLKHYSDGTVYLKDKTEFEIELFNPTTKKVMAKIYLNGTSISSSGIVLKPGQRVFLERWLDVPRKFIFDTYTTDGSEEAKAATVNNGAVKVEFYDETVPMNTHWVYPIYEPSYYNNFRTNCNVTYGSAGLAGPVGPSGITGTPDWNGTYYSTTGAISASNSGGTCSSSTFTCSVNEDLSREVETGRAELGSASSQNFVNDASSFNYYYSTVVNLKLVPESHKPAEEIRSYCTSCGAKKKGPWNFCPICGGKM